MYIHAYSQLPRDTGPATLVLYGKLVLQHSFLVEGHLFTPADPAVQIILIVDPCVF